MKKTESFDVLIAGGGASGLFCAAQCAKLGLSCGVIEKNDRLGLKLSITGKGRCNVTNNCDADTVMKNIPRNPRFMFSSLQRFAPADTMAYFESLGAGLKTERGNRVFPVSDKARDIVDALVNECRRLGVTFITDEVCEILTENGKALGFKCKGSTLYADSVVIACGGRSYPKTGSDGSGYALAKGIGHTVTAITPSLCPMVCREADECAEAMGLSLKNCTLSLYKEGKKKPIYKELGEMLFTHFGLSGPLVLSASAHIDNLDKYGYTVAIDLKPALDEPTLDKRILRDFAEDSNKDLSNALRGMLPQKIIPMVMKRAGLDPDMKPNSITKQQRRRLLETMKDLRFEITRLRPIDEAIITRGGVSVKEIDPSSMASKLCEGAYFIGEVLDVDAYTGGFNLQIAFSTAFAAAQSIADSKASE